MKVVIDIEANSLKKPTQIWVIVCKDITTGDLHIFREPCTNEEEKKRFLDFAQGVSLWCGHNWLNYDLPVLRDLLGLQILDVASVSCDTLILSRLINFTREGGHSIESYGEEFGLPKKEFNDFKRYSLEMELYCIRDVEICHKVYLKYLKYYDKEEHKSSILMEHRFQYTVVNTLEDNGFRFNVSKAKDLLRDVEKDLAVLDKDILSAFPPKLKLVREITPKVTKHGTLSLTDFRWLRKEAGDTAVDVDLSEYNGGPFCRCSWVSFNPASHKQVIDVLHGAGWEPLNKTTAHVDLEREIKTAKRSKSPVDIKELYDKLEHCKKYGYKIDETNLSTLPDTAPAPARSLAKRIMLESRRRTLTEWLGLVDADTCRIHGKFQGIGTWTHRMATQRPNMQNIPNEFDTDGRVKYLGKELRQLWQAPRNRLLVGVDAEGIQLRIFAHYINDQEFTDALVKGKKADKTDPHSLNQRILGSVCKSRAAAKRFIYALLLGAGLSKLSQILGCSDQEAEEALDRLIQRYTGWARLKEEVIPHDARRGYFIGLDNRKVAIPGDTTGNRKHLCMSGYLQNGEAIVMKRASLNWFNKLKNIDKLRWLIVNMVHDEWQTEVNNNMELALLVAKTQAESLREVGEELNLLCPLAGSYWNDDHGDYTIGTNWYQTH